MRQVLHVGRLGPPASLAISAGHGAVVARGASVAMERRVIAAVMPHIPAFACLRFALASKSVHTEPLPLGQQLKFDRHGRFYRKALFVAGGRFGVFVPIRKQRGGFERLGRVALECGQLQAMGLHGVGHPGCGL